jgi:hypothetical protein
MGLDDFDFHEMSDSEYHRIHSTLDLLRRMDLDDFEYKRIQLTLDLFQIQNGTFRVFMYAGPFLRLTQRLEQIKGMRIWGERFESVVQLCVERIPLMTRDNQPFLPCDFEVGREDGIPVLNTHFLHTFLPDPYDFSILANKMADVAHLLNSDEFDFQHDQYDNFVYHMQWNDYW